VRGSHCLLLSPFRHLLHWGNNGTVAQSRLNTLWTMEVYMHHHHSSVGSCAKRHESQALDVLHRKMEMS
jgi:hypothetical protein